MKRRISELQESLDDVRTSCSCVGIKANESLCMLQLLSHSVVSDSLQPLGLQPASLLCPWGFSRQEYWSRLPFPSAIIVYKQSHFCKCKISDIFKDNFSALIQALFLGGRLYSKLKVNFLLPFANNITQSSNIIYSLDILNCIK